MVVARHAAYGACAVSNQVVPLTNAPNQNFRVTVDVNGKTVTLNCALRYSEMADYWVLSISDASGNLLLDSVPLLTGVWPAANILGQYGYLGIGSAYVINTGNDTSSAFDSPDNTNLGDGYVLVWGDQPTP